MVNATPPGLTFGIFPGLTGAEPSLGHAGAAGFDPDRADEAIGRLQAPGRPFLVRGYEIYRGGGRVDHSTPGDLARYAHSGRRLDLVLGYALESGDLGDWTDRCRRAVRENGPHLDALQVTEEPNNPDYRTGGNGGFPRVREAIVAGVLAARDEADRLGLPLSVGFNACPSFDPADPFWPALRTLGGRSFHDALGYVGLDFFPDVFRPIPLETIASAVEAVLTHFRRRNLTAAGIPEGTPIRITENGWPTGPDRPEAKQAAVLDTVVRAVHRLRGPLGITHFEFFSLRDGVSADPAALTRFGLLRDDDTPKPAFDVYRRLVAELGP